MASFHPARELLSPSDVAFEGFRLSKERPKAILVWAVLSFAVSLVTLAPLLSSGVGKAMVMAETGESDAAAAVAALEKGGPAYLLMIGLGLVVQAVMMSAVFRATFRPEERRLGYLRLGKDELRQVVLFLILVAILMVAVFVIVLAGGIVAAVLQALLGWLGPAGVALGILAGTAVGLGMAALTIYIVVRLSLAPPMTFWEGRLRVRHAWKMTEGVFWRLFGAYFLAVVMFVVVSLLAMVIVAGVGGVLSVMLGYGLEGVGSIFHPDMTSLKTYVTIPTLVSMLVSALLQAIYYAVVFSPPAVAYRILRPLHPELVEGEGVSSGWRGPFH